MKKFAFLAVLLALPAAAQSPGPARRSGADSSSAVADIRQLWVIASGYVLAAAEAMPDSAYAFKPAPEVRSFGQLIGHVANGQQLLCGMALGQSPVETGPTSKAELLAALKESNALCAGAYALADADATKPLNATAQKAWAANGFGTPRSRLYALMMNAWHDNEHYGNIVTYMRLRGMVPPSSQPRP
ncbi:MAG: DinB-like domain protein [Gemmatimonadetes bacterium]|nr:DinB-like domain protein [Gemmatimonadota bacterium]